LKPRGQSARGRPGHLRNTQRHPHHNCVGMEPHEFAERLVNVLRGHQGGVRAECYDVLVDALSKLALQGPSPVSAYVMYMRARLIPPAVIMREMPFGRLWTLRFEGIVGRATRVEVSETELLYNSSLTLVVYGMEVCRAVTWRGLALEALKSGALTSAQMQALLPYFCVGAQSRDVVPWPCFSEANEQDWAGHVLVKMMWQLRSYLECPWRLWMFADLLRMLPCEAVRHSASLEVVLREAAFRSATAKTVLQPALARGWYLHGWYADVLVAKTFACRELRIGAVGCALLFAAGLSVNDVGRQYLPGDVIWELALLCGAAFDPNDLLLVDNASAYGPVHLRTKNALGGYAWPLRPIGFHVPWIADVEEDRRRRWTADHDAMECPSIPRLAWAVG
jgi:hypothetical protein